MKKNKIAMGLSLLIFLLPLQAFGQAKIPDPFRIFAKYETVWDAVRVTLEELKMDIRLEDRSGGKIGTHIYEFSNPTLAAGDLAKFCTAPNLTDGTWAKARYEVESIIERLEGNEIQVTINATIGGLKRGFDLKETWVDCPSNGGLERRVYSRIGSKLMGTKYKPVEKEDFWDKSPTYVPGQKTGPDTMPKPDRRP